MLEGDRLLRRPRAENSWVFWSCKSNMATKRGKGLACNRNIERRARTMHESREDMPAPTIRISLGGK